MMPLPAKKYSIIYADPPWWYNDKLPKSRRVPYSLQPMAWISDLPVGDLAADDCFLFLWVTLPKLNEVFEVIEAWGFEYKTAAFVWIKTIPKGRSLAWGMGRWTRANAELVLIATKGKPKRIHRGVHQVVFSPVRAHSQKPDEIRDKIVKLCGDLPRIELFARQKVDGWDVWGNEAPRERRRGLLDA